MTVLLNRNSEMMNGGRKGCLPFGMLSISDGVTDNVLEENLENTASLLVNEAGDTFHTTTTSKTTNSRFSDT